MGFHGFMIIFMTFRYFCHTNRVRMIGFRNQTESYLNPKSQKKSFNQNRIFVIHLESSNYVIPSFKVKTHVENPCNYSIEYKNFRLILMHFESLHFALIYLYMGMANG